MRLNGFSIQAQNTTRQSTPLEEHDVQRRSRTVTVRALRRVRYRVHGGAGAAGACAGARILELGDGHAHFLGWATARGCKVVGTEINLALHEAASSAG